MTTTNTESIRQIPHSLEWGMCRCYKARTNFRWTDGAVNVCACSVECAVPAIAKLKADQIRYGFTAHFTKY